LSEPLVIVTTVSEDGADESDESRGATDTRRRYTVLVVLTVAELLTMTLWFSASAVGRELADAWDLSSAQMAWLTNAVQLGSSSRGPTIKRN